MFAITAVVTSHFSSFEYTISVHAVHASAERNVCNSVVSIYFKYILAGRQDLILTSVAHLGKRLSYRLWGLGGEDLEWGRGKCASLYTGIDWRWFGVLQYYTHFSPHLHVLTWYTRGN